MLMFKSLLLVVVASFASSAYAGPQADALGTCLAENTTGKDRKDLARWLFAGMAAHPEIRRLSAVSDKDRQEASKTMAAQFTKLLSESCPTQAKTAMQTEGSAAMQTAFGTLGQLAMQELMSNREVNAAMSEFEQFVDQKKVQSAIGAR